MKTSIDFPELSTEEMAHSEQLIEKIVIKMNGGVLPFADYMQMALYEPGLGYYAAGATKIGQSGDFITAPEVSALFGQCLAQAIKHCFQQGKKAYILEFGAGTGKLCFDIVEQLNVDKVSWDGYFILETSADLIERQQQFLQQQLSTQDFKKIVWINQLPKQFNGVVIGNEVLDAMPVHIVLKQKGWHELGVAFEDHKFVWKEVSGVSVAAQKMQLIEQQLGVDLPVGYCTEINCQHEAWLKSLYDACALVDVLLIDYGYFQPEYYHVERMTGTLMCYFRHRGHSDPLILPGLQDITASVDFTALAQAAEQLGFCVNSISTQAEFLIQHHLVAYAKQQTAKGIHANKEVNEIKTAQQVKTLTLPSEMGEIFKVMSFTKN